MIDARGIESVIPHRGNMRMVDEIRELTENRAVGIKYVRDDEFWRIGKFFQSFCKFVGDAADWTAFFVQKFSDYLNLRKNQPAFRGLNVLRHYQNYHIAFFAEVACKRV